MSVYSYSATKEIFTMNLKKSSVIFILLLILLCILAVVMALKRENCFILRAFRSKTAITCRKEAKKSPSKRKNEVVCAIEKALPSVVNIGTERIVENPGYFSESGEVSPTLYDEFIHSQESQKSYSLGSGFIIDASGLIVTNAHVVERATKIYVTLSNGQNCEANVIADDMVNDIALLRLKNPPGGLQEIQCDYSGILHLGETVIAVGNPFGLDSSISVGALSGKKRRFSYKGRVIFSDILQTDAIVYPGNSGGPLINVDGEVIGMSMSVYENAPGIGFAIPLSRIENVLAKWMIPERFEHLSLGIVPGLTVLENNVRRIIVSDVLRDSPAAAAGMRRGEQILCFNGREVVDVIALSRELISLKDRESVVLATDRGTYKMTVRKIVYDDVFSLARRKLSLPLMLMTASIARELGYPLDSGLVVNGILPETPPEVKRGDILVKLNTTAINSPADLATALRTLHYHDTAEAVFLMKVVINDRSYFAKRTVSLPVK